MTLPALPSGRFPCTPADVQLAWATDPWRRRLWSHWEAAAAATRTIVPIASCWIAGSFISPKPRPGDLDCVWIIREDVYNYGLAQPNGNWLRLLASGHDFRVQTGLLIDSFVLPWRPVDVTPTALDGEYLWGRGYWDHLWLRSRSTATDVVERTQPARGYVEVTIDGYL